MHSSHGYATCCCMKSSVYTWYIYFSILLHYYYYCCCGRKNKREEAVFGSEICRMNERTTQTTVGSSIVEVDVAFAVLCTVRGPRRTTKEYFYYVTWYYSIEYLILLSNFMALWCGAAPRERNAYRMVYSSIWYGV